MDAGTAAVVGAAVGVVGTTLAAAVTGLSGQRQVRAEHRHWRRQLRRGAYAEFTARADEVTKLLKEAAEELMGAAPDPGLARDRIAEARAVLHDGLAGARATVEIEGPEKLARDAAELSRALSACVPVLRAAAHGLAPGAALDTADVRRVRRFVDQATAKRDQFVGHARTVIDV